MLNRPHGRRADLNRRDWLRAGSVAATGLALPTLNNSPAALAAVAAHGTGFGRARSCIILFLSGGPSQIDTWDPKPDAPVEVRGTFKPIATHTPGLQICETLPRTAALSDYWSVIRSMSTRDNAHSSSGYAMLTGMSHTPMNAEDQKPGAPNDWPAIGAVVQKFRPQVGGIPAAFRLPSEIWNNGRILWPGQDSGFLGRAVDPWLLNCDPSEKNFNVPGLALAEGDSRPEFDRRRQLLSQIGSSGERAAQRPTSERWSQLQQQALDLIGSDQSSRVFRLKDEPAGVRDRYGRSRFGQSVLLARRLVETGVSLVQVNWSRRDDDPIPSPMWDTHGRNEERLRDALAPPADQAYSALLEDLRDRGLLDQTLVVWMAEFGRTPKINRGAGRDHWGHVFSVAMAGGGVRGGQTLGASDKIAAYPASRPFGPNDLAATIFHSLGISPESTIHDRLGRPLPISSGQVISQLF